MILDSPRRLRHGGARNGAQRAPEYRSWLGMKERCYNPNHHAFERYGGRGIKVCDRWRESFAAFLADIGPRPSRLYSIDRYPNKDGDYEPGNCRWATVEQQNRNRRGLRLVEYDGKTMTMAEAARMAGLHPAHVHLRMRNGWPEKDWFLPSLRPGAKRSSQ